jgi:16S rRNA processing protein RimM
VLGHSICNPTDGRSVRIGETGGVSHFAQWVSAGRVGRPHGLDGSFHVVEPNPGLLLVGSEVVIGDRQRRVTRRAGTDQRVIVRLDGCENRGAAESLRGEELLVARSQAPELDPDEWWAEDLQGCTVHDAGRMVGTVRRLLGLPSCEVLEVQREEGLGDLLVPLVRDAVRDVDLDRREIDIDLWFLGED